MNFLGPLFILPTVAVSSTTAYTSIPLDLREKARYSLQTEFTSGATGGFTVQGSLDYNLPGVNSPTWDTIASITLNSIAGLAGSQILDIVSSGIPYVRVVYTNTGGSGNVSILGFAKTI